MKRYRRTRLTESHQQETRLLTEHLRPLMRGEVVRLQVEYEKYYGRTKRKVQLLALFAPPNVYGLVDGAVTISLIGKGSCIIIPKTGKGLGALTTAGFPVRLASELMDSLKELYGETHHDTKSTSTRRRTRQHRASST